jgi:chorismate mutase
MQELERLRLKIDALDQTIMNALNERFSLMKSVKEAKEKLKIAVTQNDREKMVLDKTALFEHSEAIKSVYISVINASKGLQND